MWTGEEDTAKGIKIRSIALDLLIKVMERGKLSHLVLREAFKQNKDFSKRDRAFLSCLLEGTLERAVQIDYFIGKYSHRPFKKLHPVLKNILRIGAFQIFWLDRVPDHAAVNTSVELLKRRRLTAFTGFLNALLRQLIRERDSSGLEGILKEAPENVLLSLPLWLYEYLTSIYGKRETEKMARYFLSAGRSFYLRYNDGRTVETSGDVTLMEGFLDGDFTVEDLSAQKVALWANPKEGDYVVDVCASPGGKCCHIALILNGSGWVDARDLEGEKIRLLLENIRRLKLKNISVKAWDARTSDNSLISEDEKACACVKSCIKNRTPILYGTGRESDYSYGKADILICDLPCSGLGVISRKPDIRFHAKYEKILELQKLQRQILMASFMYLKKGGRLLYSTCTLSKEENQDNTDWILSELPFEFIRDETLLPGKPSDGFYIAEFKRL